MFLAGTVPLNPWFAGVLGWFGAAAILMLVGRRQRRQLAGELAARTAALAASEESCRWEAAGRERAEAELRQAKERLAQAEAESAAKPVTPPPTPVLPPTSPAERSAAVRPAQPFPVFQGQILLAEDHPTNQMVVVGILEKMGCQVDAVATGREAVAALSARAYDLVLMDCQMPEMDGFEAARSIRSPASSVLNPRIPIIALTGQAISGDRERCLDAGMDEYLTKPVRYTELAEVLRRRLPKDRPAAGAVTPKTAAPPPAPAPLPTTPTVPAPPAAITATIFDRDSLLARLGGDARLAGSIVESFLSDLTQRTTELNAAVAGGDGARAARLAHRLAGAAGVVGGVALQQAGLGLEQACRAADSAAMQRGVAAATRESERLNQALSAFLKPAPVNPPP